MGEIIGLLGTLFHTLFYLPVFNGLMLIYALVHSLAFSIVLLTVLIRVCLIPLTRKQLQAGRKMQELQPQLQQLKAQYRSDPQGLMQAQRALFKENNYSQAQGCLPLLIQMPLLYALFFSFSTILSNSLTKINADIFAFVPKLTQLPNTTFLWMNLAHPDPTKLLPLLAGILTFIQMRMAMPVRPKPKPGQAPDATQQASKMTMYLLPAMTFFFGLNFPAGMALYWCVGTLFMAIQQYFLGGWGSLFVGIPGMERFVPEPKVVPALVAPARGGAASRAAASRATSGASSRGAAALPPTAAPARSGGVRGMFRQLRERMDEAQRQAMEVRTARLAANSARRNGTVVEDAAGGEIANGANGAQAEKPFTAAQGQAGMVRPSRQRPAKQAPMLVKPAQKSALAMKPLTRPGSDNVSSNGSDIAPKTTTAQVAGSETTRESTSAAGGRRPTTGAATTRPSGGSAATRPPTADQRKGSAGSAKGSSARPRANHGRPKGGR